MRKTMKSFVTKRIVVKLNKDVSFEFDIDTEIHDDVYLEAATRALEKIRHGNDIIRPIIECWEKSKTTKPSEYILCNTYWIMVNAAMYDKAEKLRKKFMAQFDKDLAKEPLRGTKSKFKQ